MLGMHRLGLAFVCVVILVGVAFGQVPTRTHVIGVLTPGHDEAMIGPRQFTIPELSRHGFIEGRNLKIEWRFAGGVAGSLPGLARELVAARVDLIIAISSVAIKAAQGATDTIPIIMAFSGDDPVAEGIVPSLARPGGNVTGLALMAAEGDLKRLQLLREAMPQAKRLAYLVSPVRRHVLKPAFRYAAETGFELDVVSAESRADYDAAFATLDGTAPSGLAIGSFPTFFNDTRDLVDRANALRIPTMCQWREMAVTGCTFAFGPPIGRLFERVGWYAAKVLNGERPSELPIERPERFELVVNLKSAHALGLDVPPTFVARADEVIE